MKPDLHMHTAFSDGVRSPQELVRYAAERGVTVMAITDHDSLDGVDSLRGADTEIPVLTGTELSLRDMKGLHLLGYGMGEAGEFRRVVRELAELRLERARKMVDRLAGLGMPMDYDELCAGCGGSVGRMHIARAMAAHGYVREPQEAFAKWIGNDGPAYVEGERLSMAEALPLMRRNGFIPVLAHPAELKKDDMTLRMLLETWQAQGLMGVEVYHPSQQKRSYRLLDAMARRMGFLVTGGSDYHSDGDGRHGLPGCTAVHWQRAQEDVDALMDAMRTAMKQE
ncbi:MAG: PHP domain-containing protein [Clostridia bacterium]|nr:PHP domain-containing protein [Clostridia bacterium]